MIVSIQLLLDSYANHLKGVAVEPVFLPVAVQLRIEGKAHAYVFPSPGCKKWDTCAPEAILHALGGKLTDIHGDFYKYNKGVGKVNEHGTLATCVLEQHQEYLDLIPQEMKDQVKDYFKNRAKK